MTKFYYYIDPDGKEQGPVEISFFKNNHINPKSLIWFEGLPQWVEAHSAMQLRNFLDSKVLISFTNAESFTDIAQFKRETPYIRTIKESQRAKYVSPTPRTWIFESILVTIFCLFPTGIIALIYASRVRVLWEAGIYAESVRSSGIAERLVKISVLIAAIAWLIYIIFYLAYPDALSTVMFFNTLE